ncbi:MAG: DinB family protein [Balneolaceae bacterium]
MRIFYSYEDLDHALQKAVQRINDFDEVPDDLFILKPAPNAWSADEVCRHLVRFNNLYIRQMDRAYESLESPGPASGGKFRTGYIQHLFIKFLEPPYKIRVKTLAPMYPVETDKTPYEVRNNLIATEKELQNRISEYHSSDLDLNRVKGRNPLLKFLPMSLIEFILYLEAHQRRHFWQIEQTLFKLSGIKF